MSLYNIVLFAHITGVIVLFMAVAVEVLGLHGLRRATTIEEARSWGGLIRLTEKPLPLGTVAILLSGLYMSLTTWDLTIPWIALSLAVVVLMSVVGPTVNGRRLEAIGRAAATAPSGPIPPEIMRQILDPVLLTSVHTSTALGFGVVFLKAIRPDLVGAFAALAVAVAVGVLSARGGTEAARSATDPALALESTTSERRIA